MEINLTNHFVSFKTMSRLTNIFVVGDPDDPCRSISLCSCGLFQSTGAFTLQLDTGQKNPNTYKKSELDDEACER